MITVYGIPNCSSVKKARAWLNSNGIDYHFHDLKKAGITASTLLRWIEQAGIERVLNRQGTTWRGLSPAEQASTATQEGAVALLGNKPSLIKRPVIEQGSLLIFGFDAEGYRQLSRQTTQNG